MKTCAFPFFLYVVYQSFRLCYRRSIQKKNTAVPISIIPNTP